MLLTDPADGAAGVSRSPVLRVAFDRPLSPRALDGESVALRSGDRTSAVRVWLDPASRTLEARPERALDPEIDYRFEVAGLPDVDGFRGEPVVVHFSTGLADVAAPEPSATWADVEAVLSRCAPCHSGASAPQGLDLSSSAAIRETALGVPAREVRTSGAPGTSAPGLVGLARIEPGHAERSYLVWKILGDPHIVGARMPYGEEPLDPSEVDVVVRWIRSGAPTE